MNTPLWMKKSSQGPTPLCEALLSMESSPTMVWPLISCSDLSKQSFIHATRVIPISVSQGGKVRLEGQLLGRAGPVGLERR